MMEGVSLVTKGRNKMRERQLRWFDHTKQRTMTAPMRRIKFQLLITGSTAFRVMYISKLD